MTSEPVYAGAGDADAEARAFLIELGRSMAGDLAQSTLGEWQAARQQASQRQEDEPVYHPVRIGGSGGRARGARARDVLAVLTHAQSPTDLYDLGDGYFAEGQRGRPGPVLHSHQFDRDALAALGWTARSVHAD